MRKVIEGWWRLRALRRRREIEAWLDDEIRFHIDRQTAKNLRAGMSPDEARRLALIRFGGVQGTKEGTRDELRLAFLEHLGRDLRYGTRALLRAPGFTIVATLTLAFGIGATTAMFSVVNGVVLRPLPYPHQDRLVELRLEAPGGVRLAGSPAVYFGYRDHSRTFEAVGLWDWDSSPVTVTGIGEPETVSSVEVTHEVLGIMGADPIAGRGFTVSDDLPGSPPTAIISYGYWQRRFGGADVVGQTLVVDGAPRQVIGVLPRWFRFFDYPADIFYPLQPVRSEAVFPSGDGRGIARLKEGVTLDQANADVVRMLPLLYEEFGRPGGFEQSRLGPNLQRLKDRVVGDLDDTLWLLMGTIGLLLAIACANVANLVLVRTQTRRPELAIRAALGAGWTAIARVVFAESAILAFAGGAAGLVIASLTLPFLLSLGAAELPEILDVTIDSTVLLVAMGTSALAAIVFALIPVVHFALPRLQPGRSLHGGGRAITDGREGNRARQLLVVSQVALALVLLVGAGLMVRTFQTLRAVDPGFREPDTVQTFQLTVPTASLADDAQTEDAIPERILRTQREILERLAAMPGVKAVGFSSSNDGLPLDGDGRQAPIWIEGRTPVDDVPPSMEIPFVSPGFFETLRTPLLAGRTFDWNDVERRGVVLVSANLARAEWGSPDAALGKRISLGGPDGPRFEVVGVVGDVHQYQLTTPAPKTVVFPALARNAIASFVIRSKLAGTVTFLEDVRHAVSSVSGTLAPANVQTLGEMYRRSIARTSMTLLLLTIAGTMALLLGLLGIYGVVSYAVSQRRREIGIRLALGAARGEVRRMFMRHALIPVGIGIAIGLAAATGLTRLMASQLFGVNPLDPPTHATVAAVLVAAAGLASYLSARRASALDPVEVLKAE